MDAISYSNKIKISNNIKYILFLLLVFIGLITVTVVCMMLYHTSKALKYKIASYFPIWCCYLMWKILDVKISMIGVENISEEACVIASNHQSIYDGIIFDKILPRHCYIAKKSIAKIPVFGWLFSITNPIYINQKKRREAMKKIIRDGMSRMASGVSVIIFPEGSRARDGVMRKYKRGAGVLAHAAMKPILPIYQNASACFSRSGKYLGAGTIVVLIGKPIAYEGQSGKNMNKILQVWAKKQGIRFLETRY